MHLVKISIFSLNNVTVRPTKIMNRADKNWANFQKIKYLKNENFQKHLFIKSWSLSPIFSKNFLETFDQFSTLINDFENHNFEMLEEVFHNFEQEEVGKFKKYFNPFTQVGAPQVQQCVADESWSHSFNFFCAHLSSFILSFFPLFFVESVHYQNSVLHNFCLSNFSVTFKSCQLRLTRKSTEKVIENYSSKDYAKL